MFRIKGGIKEHDFIIVELHFVKSEYVSSLQVGENSNAPGMNRLFGNYTIKTRLWNVWASLVIRYIRICKRPIITFKRECELVSGRGR